MLYVVEFGRQSIKFRELRMEGSNVLALTDPTQLLFKCCFQAVDH